MLKKNTSKTAVVRPRRTTAIKAAKKNLSETAAKPAVKVVLKKTAKKIKPAEPIERIPEQEVWINQLKQPLSVKAESKKIIIGADGKKYVAINDHDPELKRKDFIVLTVVAIIAIFLVISWFFSLRQNVSLALSSFKSGQIRTSISGLMDKLKNEDPAITINQADLDAVKEEIIKKVNAGMTSSIWPVHQSELLGLSIKYPEAWNKKEITDTLTLSSYPINTAAPSIFGQITIKKMFDKKNSLEEYLDDSQKNLYEIDPAMTALSGWPAIKYVKKNTGTDISWIIIAGQGNKILKIESYSQNGQGLYEKLFSEIISTIKF